MTKNNKLEMYGGYFGGTIPLLVLIAFLVWLSVTGKGGITAFWVGGWFGIVIGLLFAKNKQDYCNSILKGLGDKNGIVIITAWIFAGVLGKLMVAGGLVDGLLWFGFTFGATGSIFTVLVFISACIFSLGTGTSTGTVLALVPVMYPAGVFLGCNPAIVAVALLSGAAFGDNLAPISDTTIVSAFTQEAKMNDVVKSRAPLSLTSATIAIIFFFIFGGSNEIKTLPALDIPTSPAGLLILISFLVVITSALLKRHIVESLVYGNIAAILLGLLNGYIELSDIFSIPKTRGDSTGIVETGISGVSGAIIFALLVLAITQILVDAGVMELILKKFNEGFVKNVRDAELSIISVTLLASIPIAANAPAILLVGPSFVKPLGEKFNLAPARKANLMDCSVCTLFFMLPWHIAVIVWYGALTAASETWHIALPSITSAFINPYSWALLAVILFSAITGWNRKYINNYSHKNHTHI